MSNSNLVDLTKFLAANKLKLFKNFDLRVQFASKKGPILGTLEEELEQKLVCDLLGWACFCPILKLQGLKFEYSRMMVANIPVYERYGEKLYGDEAIQYLFDLTPIDVAKIFHPGSYELPSLHNVMVRLTEHCKEIA